MSLQTFTNWVLDPSLEVTRKVFNVSEKQMKLLQMLTDDEEKWPM